MSRNLLVHIDVDSPLKLIDFYKLKGVEYDLEKLETFYKISWERALRFFEKHNIKATFFVVGNELENSEVVREVVLEAFKAGHEIENHTYSHPFGLATLADHEISNEIKKCSDVIEDLTGTRPAGFRSPGYSISSKVINILEEQGFGYDSSGFWSVMNPVLKSTSKLVIKNGSNFNGFGEVSSSLPNGPYMPDTTNWIKQSDTTRNIWELPLPRTDTMAIPFYNNFNLWMPWIAQRTSKKIERGCLVYLFHIIEFMDLSENTVPLELKVHPNINLGVGKKTQLAETYITNLLERHEAVSTRTYFENITAPALSEVLI